MIRLFETVVDVEADRERLKKRAYGVIEVCDQELKAIHLRPYPKLISTAEIGWANLWKKPSFVPTSKDRVLLYYNQPIMHRNFLALKYFVSDYKSSLASIAVSLSVLDYIAMVKQTDAMVTEITNKRIKDRHLTHFGWEEHLQHSRTRHWIRRFYGEYPQSFLFQEISKPRETATSVPEPLSKSRKPVLSIPVINSGSPVVDATQSQVH